MNAHDDIELLLPWRATGGLSAEEERRVDAALAADADLRCKYELVREELAATVSAAEELGAPSVGVRNRLFAQIAAEAKAEARPVAAPGLRERILQFFGSLSPGAVAWSAAAAALVIVAQGAILTRSVGTIGGGSFQTASVSSDRTGSFALVAFAPQASAQQISEFLEGRGASIVEGPKPGGLYRLRIADKRLDADAMKAAVGALAARPDIIRMAVASE